MSLKDRELALLSLTFVLALRPILFVPGLAGALENKPQLTTVTALEPTTVYRMSLDELMDSAGGRELPISQVLLHCAEMLREAAVKLTETEGSEK